MHGFILLNHFPFPQNDDHKPESVEDTLNHVSEKKEPVVHTVHSKVQPTTEQLMIAKIIDHSDDPHQKRKIKQVINKLSRYINLSIYSFAQLGQARKSANVLVFTPKK